jgi:small-conductance mechanosensitive channel
MWMTFMFFVVYAGFIAWFSFLIMPAISQLSSARIAQRNPEWLCAQPEFAERLCRRKLPALLSRLLGVALLAALCFAAFAAQPLEAMTGVFLASILAVALSFILDTWSAWRLGRLVPAPAKREADLGSTRYEDHTPMPWVQYWYVALSAVLACYGLAFVLELVPRGLAAGRVMWIGMLIALSWFGQRHFRKLPAQPGQRKVSIGAMVFCLLVVASAVAHDFLGAPQINDLWFFFSVAVAIQVGLAVATIRATKQGTLRSR